MRKIETSKLILYVSYTIAAILAAIVVIGTFTDHDVSNVTQIALAAWAEVATANAFYYKKSERENICKNLPKLPKELLEKIDINQIINK